MPLHPEVGVGAQRRVPIQYFLALFGLEPQSAGNCVAWAVGAGAADVITASASPPWAMAAASAAWAWDIGIGVVAGSTVA